MANQASELAGLFTCPVALEIAIGDWPASALLGPEIEAMRHARPLRRREFVTGRTLARRALAALGGPSVPIPRGPDRAPLWPEGYVGSIAHCDIACCAVAAKSRDAHSLGIDIEPAQPLGTALIPLIVRPEEQARFGRLENRAVAEWTTIAFCAKEAFYKSWYGLNRRYLDFLDVDVELRLDEPDAGGFSAVVRAADEALSAKVAYDGRWRLAHGLIWAGATAGA